MWLDSQNEENYRTGERPCRKSEKGKREGNLKRDGKKREVDPPRKTLRIKYEAIRERARDGGIRST